MSGGRFNPSDDDVNQVISWFTSMRGLVTIGVLALLFIVGLGWEMFQ